MTDDQFDFHTYCLRKSTIRAYISLIKLEDQLRSHAYYLECAKGAVMAYIRIYDKPKAVANGEDGDLATMSSAERKKARSKAKKAQLKASKEAEVKKVDIKDEKVKKVPVNDKKHVDDDPQGEKYVKTSDPLADALKFLKPLQDWASNRIDTHLLGFDIYIRQRKFLLSLRSLVKSSQIDDNNIIYRKQLVRFYQAIQEKDAFLHPTVKKVIDLEVTKVIPEGQSISELNDKYLARVKERGDLAGLIAGAEVIYLIDPSKKAEAEALILDNIGKEEFVASRTLQNVSLTYTTLKDVLKSTRTDELKTLAREWFPLAVAFK